MLGAQPGCKVSPSPEGTSMGDILAKDKNTPASLQEVRILKSYDELSIRHFLGFHTHSHLVITSIIKMD